MLAIADMASPPEPWGESEDGSSLREESPMFVEQEFDEDDWSGFQDPYNISASPETQVSPDIQVGEDVNLAEGNEVTGGREAAGDSDSDPDNDHDPDNNPGLNHDVIDDEDEQEASNTSQDSDSDSESSSDSHSDGAQDNNQGAGPHRNALSSTCRSCTRLQRIRTRLQRRIGHKDRTIQKKNIKIELLKGKIKKLREEIRSLREVAKNPQKQSNSNRNRQAQSRPIRQRTWPTLLRKFSAGNFGISYDKVWRCSNSEENMSINVRHIHPNIRLVGPEERPRDTEREPTSLGKTRKFERFNDLPQHIQFRIFRFLLYFDGCLIHVFSRLDPYSEDEPSPRPRSQSGLPPKLFVSNVRDGKQSVSLANAIDPAKLLQPLLTCKRWCFYLSHVFFALNTFGLSSLGELERWCNGIGPARVQRLQHLELNWKGGVQRAYFEGDSSQKLRHRNLHAYPLMWLRECLRLRTLVIFVSETAKSSIRRPWEPQSHIQMMQRNTSGQPNARMTRSMRSLLGLDYILTLRGLKWIKFYDVDMLAVGKGRSHSQIRDQSFVRDVSNSITQGKVPAQAKKCRLDRLDRLFPRGGWEPTQADFAALTAIYGSTSRTGGARFNDLDIDCDERQGTPPPSSGDCFEEGSNSDSESESEGQNDDRVQSDLKFQALPTPPKALSPSPRNCRTRSPTPALSGFGSSTFLDSSADEADEDGQSDAEETVGLDLLRAWSEGDPLRRSQAPDTLVEARERLRRLAAGDADDDVLEMSSSMSGRQSTSGLFVTPGPLERTSEPSFVPDDQIIDLTGIDSDDEVDMDNTVDTTGVTKHEIDTEGSDVEESKVEESKVEEVVDVEHRESLVTRLNLFTEAIQTPVPPPRILKRGSPANSEPSENRKRQMREFPHGPDNGWSWSLNGRTR